MFTLFKYVSSLATTVESFQAHGLQMQDSGIFYGAMLSVPNLLFHYEQSWFGDLISILLKGNRDVYAQGG